MMGQVVLHTGTQPTARSRREGLATKLLDVIVPFL